MPEQKQAQVPGSVALGEVGRRLERLRTRTGLTLSDAAAHCTEHGLRTDASALSRIENGRRRTIPRDLVTALLDHYRAGAEDRAEILKLLSLDPSPSARRRRPALWRRHRALLDPMGFEQFMELEAQATELSNYEPALVPGLLQTAAYAHHAITGIRPELTPAQIEALCDVRLHRQHIIAEGPLREFEALIDEDVLHRTIGGPAVMRQQLEHLLTASESPTTTLRVVPRTPGSHPGLAGPFVIMNFPEATHAREIVWIETLSTSVRLDQEMEVTHYTDAFTLLSGRALDPAQSRIRLKEKIQEHST
ncbi:helix-turn-helix domain-containing protein [Streptomyces sp. NPDC088789]|uniref:helix-turn-helix domain-containing protein n=1 Tax=Streptomyces sp. NPDC088789 TaxID=3365899 RepID=UPI0037F46B64